MKWDVLLKNKKLWINKSDCYLNNIRFFFPAISPKNKIYSDNGYRRAFQNTLQFRWAIYPTQQQQKQKTKVLPGSFAQWFNSMQTKHTGHGSYNAVCYECFASPSLRLKTVQRWWGNVPLGISLKFSERRSAKLRDPAADNYIHLLVKDKKEANMSCKDSCLSDFTHGIHH